VNVVLSVYPISKVEKLDPEALAYTERVYVVFNARLVHIWRTPSFAAAVVAILRLPIPAYCSAVLRVRVAEPNALTPPVPVSKFETVPKRFVPADGLTINGVAFCVVSPTVRLPPLYTLLLAY
jgi:hypothetical protein